MVPTSQVAFSAGGDHMKLACQGQALGKLKLVQSLKRRNLLFLRC